MMKCAMVVIWGALEELGIDYIMGLLYKGATHRAVLSVIHFNKSLRATRLQYTALLILNFLRPCHHRLLMKLSN